MTWIKTIPFEKASGRLKDYYKDLRSLFPKEYQDLVSALVKSDGTSDSIVAAHSLLPEVLKPLFLGLAELLSPKLPLSRKQHEMINTLVSSLNHCHY